MHVKHHKRFINRLNKRILNDKDVEIARLKLNKSMLAIGLIVEHEIVLRQEAVIEASHKMRDSLNAIIEMHKQLSNP